jgi:hypothetical protein
MNAEPNNQPKHRRAPGCGTVYQKEWNVADRLPAA